MKSLALLAVLCAASGASASVLLDFRPATTNTTGYSVGNSFFQWEIYQPFTVTSPAGWNLDRISLSGFLSAGVASGALLLEIASTTTSPALASTTTTISNTSAGTLAYVGGDIDVDLVGGASYVLRVKSGSTSPFTDVGIHYGIGGPVVTSRAAGTGFTRVQNTPIATFFEGSIVPSPGAAGLISLGGLMMARRRR